MRRVVCCSVFLFAFIFASAGGSLLVAQSPVFESGIVSVRTRGHKVDINANIAGATDLYLVVDAAGGYQFDWCTWIHPVLTAADGSTRSLTELEWKHAHSDSGRVRKNRNCQGGELSVLGSPVTGPAIGTHANSVIHFELPAGGFQTFSATGALDDGGVEQNDIARERAGVRFAVYTQRPSERYFGAKQSLTVDDHDSAQSETRFDVHPELEVSLFAAEPQLVNPSNIDVDHLGRVWVCEVKNYRRRSDTRPEGDRLLVLDDTDGDGKADTQSVFYQGPDIDSLHGVCVLGDRALISAGSEVFFLIDTDGDLKADTRKVLFTGIKGVQHDHGIHAFVFGPDGKFYFNFGNAGRQLCDPDGNVIIDAAGNEARQGRGGYREGMVFRCNADGTEVETLAWNFRNNWEVCVDSFGRMWQSDNDDDGNRAVRINYLMPFGNYGFRDEKTGGGWRTGRIGMAADIPSRHWHQNDPGVVPNLLQTGAGSPTGICFYEGGSLPGAFQNQIIHCDAGPNVVRCYPLRENGSGYSAGTVSIMDGSKYNQWFRPSDVCVAPDGSLMVADWYDPGVGGHGMGDIDHGRIFRVTPKGSAGEYEFPVADFSTPENACKALASPNLATRYLAWNALQEFGESADGELVEMLESDQPHLAARAAWVLGTRNPGLIAASPRFTGPCDEELRCAFARILLQTPMDKKEQARKRDAWLMQLAMIPEPRLKRTILAGISRRAQHKISLETRKRLVEILVKDFQPGDRWFLESLGIACDGEWDKFKDVLNRESFSTEQWHDVLWRSRFEDSPQQLTALLSSNDLDAGEVRRYFRALDFFENTGQLFLQLATSVDESAVSGRTVFVESALRVDPGDADAQLTEKIRSVLDDLPSETGIRLVERFQISDRVNRVYDILLNPEEERQMVVDAGQTLVRMAPEFLESKFDEETDERFSLLMEMLERVRSPALTELFKRYALDVNKPLERRKRSVLALARAKPGADAIVRWVSADRFDKRLEPAISAALHASAWDDIVEVAEAAFPLPAGDDRQPPQIRELVKMSGDVIRGAAVFQNSGTCAKCHIVGGDGVEVGPDLSGIGAKLSRQAMFEAIIFPSAAVSHGYENWSILTVDGDLLSGLILSDTDEQIELKDAEGVVHRIPVDRIEGRNQQSLSLMPGDLHKLMTGQELTDLVEYLMTLKK